MDKPTDRVRQIKIKINGIERNYKEELINHDWKTKREIAAAKEKESPVPQWNSAIRKVSYKKRKKIAPKKRKWGNLKGNVSPALVLSIISAMMVGILIGLVLWNLMIKKPDTQDATNPSNGMAKGKGTSPFAGGRIFYLARRRLSE